MRIIVYVEVVSFSPVLRALVGIGAALQSLHLSPWMKVQRCSANVDSHSVVF